MLLEKEGKVNFQGAEEMHPAKSLYSFTYFEKTIDFLET